jgi:DNA-binding response OmpR family regulator
MIAGEIKPSVITLDVQLADGEGWDVLKELKANEATRHIPVLMVSILEDRERAEKLGAADCFTKPVLKDRLLGAIAQQIAAGGGAPSGEPVEKPERRGEAALAASGAEASPRSGAKRNNGRARG